TVAGYDFTNVTVNHTIDAYFSIDVFTITATASAGGSITPSGAVNVNYAANQSFTIMPNTGYHIDSVVVDGANQGAVANYDFTNVTVNHTIDAYFSINNYIINAGGTANGTITPSGTISVMYGSDQGFTITPATGYYISDVHVDSVSAGATASYSFTNVTEDHSIFATFDLQAFTINASAGPNGSISPSGAVNVNYGSNQSFTIMPNTGYHIDSVAVDGVNQGAVASYDFTNVTVDHTIDAYFSIDVFTVTGTASAGGNISPSGAVIVNYGSNQSFSVTPNTGYHIDSVVVDGANQGTVAGYDFTNVTVNHTIDAYFSIDVFTITATASAGGSISPSGSININYGGGQSFGITPNTGYHVDSVVVDGVNQGPVPTVSFTNVTSNRSIAAYFSIDVLTITASATLGGSISPSGAVSVNYGSDRSFSITPNTGSHIDSVVVDGLNLGVIGAYNFTSVTANHAIDAYFSINVFTIAATSSAGGSITPSGSVIANYGSNRSFTVAPNAGYHTDSVVMDGVSQGTPAGYDFINVTANHSIAAWFSLNTYAITASAGPGGSISPSGTSLVVNGGNRTFTVAPDTGYLIDSVIIDGAFAGTPSSYTFSGVTSVHTIRAVFVQYTFSYEVVPEWNLVSVPQTVPDRRISAVYPLATAPVYIYKGSGYVTTDSIDHGPGYWVKLPGNQPVSVDGLPVAVDTIPVGTRWNIIGSVAVPVSVDDVVQDPPANAVTEFFGYDAGYSIADSIMPGKAYWVKTAMAGQFILNGQGTANAPKTSTARRPASDLAKFNRLEFARAGSGTGNGNPVKGLWFGPDPEGSFDPGRFELPPMPPAGVFDVRFRSQTNLAIVPESPADRWEITVLIRSSRWPLEISWTQNPGDRRRYELIGKKGDAVTFRRTIDGSGSASIEADDGTQFLLSAAAIPAAYALAQNYPNPFNPSTTISFDLPEERRVRLEVYNVIGELVSTLISGEVREAGRHTAALDAAALPSGVYFYRIQAGEFSAMRKMVLLR
ncbi:MAG TPA: T9SS type A sorting domain-containing protein, partial [Bacteroidota bacterium]|nr:T9SS type A sorting domain-containing protein [Bacteroidota bacterium]